MNSYIEKVSSLITNKRDKKQIVAELQSHIDDKIDYYLELGYDREEAEKRATEEMGSPEDTAVSLNSLHNNKWYTARQNIIAIILLLGAIIAIAFFYPKYFYADDVFQTVAHNVISDFISLAIFSVYVGLIIFAAKKRNSRIVYAVLYSLIFALVLAFSREFIINTGGYENNQVVLESVNYDGFFYRMRNIFGVFQPMLYALGTILTKGFAGYIDSLFSYSLADDYMSGYYVIGSFVLFVFLLLWAFAVLIMIIRQSKLKNTKRFIKPLKITRDIVCVFIALNFAVMSVCTVISSFSLEDKLRESNAARSAAIDFVINAEIGDSREQVIENMNHLITDYGFTESTKNAFDGFETMFDIKSYVKNCFGVVLFFSEEKLDTASFMTYTFDTNYLTAPLRVDREELKKYENIYLSEFKKTELFEKAFSVSKNEMNINIGFATADNTESLVFEKESNDDYRLFNNSANILDWSDEFENQ